jgi:uncharacterized membrane protein YccC
MSSTPAPAPPAAPHKYLADSYIFQWQNQTLRADLILTLPIALCLGIGVAVHHPAAGMIAAGGAMNTGFGKKQSIDDTHLLPMIFVTVGMALAGFLGVLIGHENFLLVAVTALLGFGYGQLTARPAGYGWVGQQCVITFLVASAFPAPVTAAADRALLLFAGGALQLLLSSILLHLFGDLRRRLMSLAHYLRAEESALRSAFFETYESVRKRRMMNAAIPYSLRLALVLAVGTEIYRELHFASGYWIPMTALIVLKPSVADTVSRALARVLGTTAGAIVVSFCLAHTHATPGVLALFTMLFAWFAYGILNVNYALYSMAITGYIVFLLSLNQLPGPQVAERRTVCTLLGGAIALSVRLVVISHRRRRWRRLALAALQQR